MSDSKKTLVADLSQLTEMNQETITLLQERLSSAKGIVLGLAHDNDEVSGYVYMPHEGIVDFIISLITEFPDIGEAIADYFDVGEDPPSKETSKAEEIENRDPPKHYIC